MGRGHLTRSGAGKVEINQRAAVSRLGADAGHDGNFYGTTSGGGSSGYGTVFRMTTNGTLTTLVSFASTNGAKPMRR